MYIAPEGKDFIVYNESGHELAARKTRKDAERFISEQKNSRKNKNNRRQERITYSSRADD